MAKYSPDTNNREQVLEFAVQTHTAPDGTKMGAVARIQVNSTGNPVENTEGVLLASAARTVDQPGPTQATYNAHGIMLWLIVTAASGTGGLTVRIQGLDGAVGVNTLQLNTTPTAVIATGRYGYALYPGASAAAPGATSTFLTQYTAGVLPKSWRAYVAAGDATSYTYSVYYSLIV